MFQFRRFPAYTYFIQCTLHGYCPCGFPHSEIPGSMDICSSPRLIAAYRVLLRLSVPRHSPCALSSLTNRKQDLSRSRLWIMQAISKIWNCNCYPHLFRCCSTIKNLRFSHFSVWKPLCCLTSLCILHCSVFKVQFSNFTWSQIETLIILNASI